MGTPKQGDLRTIVVDESKIREIPTPDTTPELYTKKIYFTRL